MRMVLLWPVCFVTLMAGTSAAQEKVKIYDPGADAAQEIAKAVSIARQEAKHVLLQIGGNWCSWCIEFNKLVTEDAELNKLMNDNFVVLHINYSKENKNEKVLQSLGFPNRFGFPVFVILDGNGTRLHTQDSAYLEDGKTGHDKVKVKEFLEQWSFKAVSPKNYEGRF